MHRSVVIALVSALTFIMLIPFSILGLGSPSTSFPDYRGDINEDGKVDVFDLLEMLKILSSPDGKTDRQKQAVDVDASGGVDVFDLLALLKVISGKEQPGVIFAEPAPTFTVRGSVLSSGIGLTGVSVLITGSGANDTSNTGTSGAYSFSGLSNGTYTVTTGKSGYTFSPVSQAVMINNANATVEDFTATTSGGTTPVDTAVVPEIALISISGATFTMGTDRTDVSWLAWSRPAHPVTLESFKIGRYEVTQEQYQAVMGLNPSKFKGNSQRPVEQVGWRDAVTFCNKLSEAAGLQPCYDLTTWTCDFNKNGYRLPTEAEWEYACRAGASTFYYTGDTATDLAKAGWYDKNSVNTSHPVGEKVANAFGAYDMHGNVWELCNDLWYDNYGSVRGPDPEGANGVYRVIRGGSWSHPDYYCCSINRSCVPSDGKYGDLGFRVVRR